MKPLKKRQHYVWRYYLKPWTTNEQIFCKRGDNLFRTSLENVGQMGFFYESVTLNSLENDYIRNFFHNMNPTAADKLGRLFNLYVITSKGDEYTRKCGIEDFHGIIEKKAIEIINMLYALDCSFFERDDYRNNFSFFIGCQYTRTKKMRENLLKFPLNTPPGISKDKLSKVYSLFFADIIGNWIYYRSKIKIIVNKSEMLSFLTADQPVINVKADGGYLTRVQQFELYYPITPKVAIYLSEHSDGIEHIGEDQVKKYNSLICRHSNEQLYALSRLDLESISLD